MLADHNALLQREQRRLEALQALGVQPLAARFDPVGARKPSRLPLPGRPASPVATGAVDTGGGPSPKGLNPVIRTGSAVGRGLLESSSGNTTRSLPSSKPVPPPQMIEDAAFQLLIAWAGDWLWIEQIEDGLLRHEQLQLVQAMAQAMVPDSVNLQHFLFEWPWAQHGHLARDADSARDSVAGQLRRLAREQQVRGMVLMGTACTEWVSTPPALTGLCIPATVTMLAEPLLKRKAWATLAPHVRSG